MRLTLPLFVLFGLVFGWAQSSAQAHLMVEQHGTLKLGDGGYYFALSFPISAVEGIDDNGDALLSARELQAHKAQIEQAVTSGFQLKESNIPLMMEGLLLNMPHSHGQQAQGVTHLVAMGRFKSDGQSIPRTLSCQLFGTQQTESSFKLTVTQGEAVREFQFTPQQNQHTF